jgi:hypothetical protein
MNLCLLFYAACCVVELQHNLFQTIYVGWKYAMVQYNHKLILTLMPVLFYSEVRNGRAATTNAPIITFRQVTSDS